jgi:NAD(P)-dependent dehydrogenase (short-subunit alcohol dehydrogenase family)
MTAPAVLVSGAASGIGRAVVSRIVRRGFRVVALDRDEAALEELARVHHEVIPFAVDIVRSDDVAAVVSEAAGGFDLVGAATFAGWAHLPGRFETLHPDALERSWLVNVVGTANVLRVVLPPLVKRGGGSILTVASQAGLRGAPGLSAYSATKHAVIGLTRTIALEYARSGVRVNALCPGPTSTPMLSGLTAGLEAEGAAITDGIPLGRLGTPDELAASAEFLLLDAPEFLTGAVLAVDGAMTAA